MNLRPVALSISIILVIVVVYLAYNNTTKRMEGPIGPTPDEFKSQLKKDFTTFKYQRYDQTNYDKLDMPKEYTSVCFYDIKKISENNLSMDIEIEPYLSKYNVLFFGETIEKAYFEGIGVNKLPYYFCVNETFKIRTTGTGDGLIIDLINIPQN